MTAPVVPVPQPPQQLPDAARERLSAPEAGDGFFTSGLSVNEFVLVGQTGFRPLGLVVGTSVYHLGLQAAKWNTSQELSPLTQALHDARGLALARMRAEAEALGADGVIGVSIRPCAFHFSREVTEFVATGTAITSEDGAHYRTPAGRAFTCHLSGQDFWTLHRHGWLPRAMVTGTCVYHLAHLTLRQTLQSAGQNRELTPYTQAVYDARELTLGRMQAEARQAGASGVVGVTVTEDNWAWGENAIEFFTLGTAVTRARPGQDAPAAVQLVLPLTG